MRPRLRFCRTSADAVRFHYLWTELAGPTRGLNRLRWLTSDGNLLYHALQVNVQKRFSSGLQFGFAYTCSKAMGEGYGRKEGGGSLPNSYQNPKNCAAEKTRYGFNFRHSAVINFLYELPTGYRIRMDITSNHFPQFDRNPNTGEPFGTSAKVRVAEQTIFHTAGRASHIVLPVVPVPKKK